MDSNKWERYKNEKNNILEQQIKQYEDVIRQVKTTPLEEKQTDEAPQTSEELAAGAELSEQWTENGENKKLTVRQKKYMYLFGGIFCVVVLVVAIINMHDKGTMLQNPVVYIKDQMLNVVQSSKSGVIVLDQKTNLVTKQAVNTLYGSLYYSSKGEEIIRTTEDGEWTYYPIDIVTESYGNVVSYTLCRIRQGEKEGNVIARDVIEYQIISEEEVIYLANKNRRLCRYNGEKEQEISVYGNSGNVTEFEVSIDKTKVLWVESGDGTNALCVQDLVGENEPSILVKDVNSFYLKYTQDFSTIYYSDMNGIYGIYDHGEPELIQEKGNLVELCSIGDHVGIYYTVQVDQNLNDVIQGNIPEVLRQQIENEYGQANIFERLYYFEQNGEPQLVDRYFMSQTTYSNMSSPALSYRSFDINQARLDLSEYTNEDEITNAFQDYIWSNSIYRVACNGQVISDDGRIFMTIPNYEENILYMVRTPVTLLGEGQSSSGQNVDVYDCDTGLIKKTFELNRELVGTEMFMKDKVFLLEEQEGTSYVMSSSNQSIGDLYYDSQLLVKNFVSSSGSALVDEEGFLCLTDYDGLTQSSVLKKMTGEYTGSMTEEIIDENVLSYKVLGKNQYVYITGTGYKTEEWKLVLYCDGKKIPLERGKVSLDIQNANSVNRY